MNTVNHFNNNAPLLSLEELGELSAPDQAAHIADHTNAVANRFHGIAFQMNPNHAEHATIMSHIHDLQQNHQHVQNALAHHEEDLDAFDNAIERAHHHLQHMIQHQNPQDVQAAAGPVQGHLDDNDSDNENSSQGSAATSASEAVSNSSGSSGGGMQIQPH